MSLERLSEHDALALFRHLRNHFGWAVTIYTRAGRSHPVRRAGKRS